MVSTQQEEIFRIFHLECKQQQYCFNLHRAPSLIITQEKVICIWRPSFFIKNFSQIVKLPVDVTNNLHWRLKFKENWLVRKNIHACQTKLRHVFLADFHVFVAILFFLRNTNLLILFQIQIPQNIDNSIGNNICLIHVIETVLQLCVKLSIGKVSCYSVF